MAKTTAEVTAEEMLATAWLHDTVEDCDVTMSQIEARFGFRVAVGVSGLSDLETGVNRAERKAKARDRLAACAGWIQTIKCADILSNTGSIVQHDPKFAEVYLVEKRLFHCSHGECRHSSLEIGS